MEKDAIEVLEADHREVEALFERVQASSAGQDDAVADIVRELSIHDAIERELLYPVVRDRIPSDGEGMAWHSLDEHEETAELLSQIESTDDAPQRDMLLRRLTTSVNDHVTEEENEIFPKLRQAMSQEELVELGSKLEGAKGRAPTHPHPHAPRSGIGAKVGGAAAAAMDRARDAAKS